MKISFYPYDFEYKVSGEKVLVHLYGKLEDGTKVCVIHQHEPYFFASIKDVDIKLFSEKLRGLTIESKGMISRVVKWEEAEKEFLGKKEKFYKIYTNIPKAVPPIAKHLQELGVE